MAVQRINAVVFLIKVSFRARAISSTIMGWRLQLHNSFHFCQRGVALGWWDSGEKMYKLSGRIQFVDERSMRPLWTSRQTEVCRTFSELTASRPRAILRLALTKHHARTLCYQKPKLLERNPSLSDYRPIVGIPCRYN